MLLPDDDVLALYDVLVSTGADRNALVAGIDRNFVLTITSGTSAAAQFLIDLRELNRTPKLLDGSIPLHIYLANAARLLGSYPQRTPFDLALAKLSLRSPTASHSPPQNGYSVALVPTQPAQAHVHSLPAILNQAQDTFRFALAALPPSKPFPAAATDVDLGLAWACDAKRELGLRTEDLAVLFVEALESRSRGLANLFVATSSITEPSPRAALISTSFIHRHVLPIDPTYQIQRSAFYHLVVACIGGAFLDLDAHEDRGCLYDFNNHIPNIRRKLEAGYALCHPCSTQVSRHSLGSAFFSICESLKLNWLRVQPEGPQDPRGRSRVFLCYARPDRERVLELHRRLTQDGFEAWLDIHDILPGQDWDAAIQHAIRTADYFVACLSSHFEKRTYGLKEIKTALDVLDTVPDGHIYLIPARLEDCRVERRLAERQWVDLFDPGGYDKLLRALRWRRGNVAS